MDLRVYLAEQTITFLQAILLGFVYGILYDAFRITRLAVSTPRWVVFAQDLLFFFICALSTFFFLMHTMDGQVRFFVLIGAILGMIIYFYSLSILIMGVSAAIIRVVKAVLRGIYKWVLLPIWRIIYSFVVFIMRPFRFFGAQIEKTAQRCKYSLKVRRNVLYNQLTSRFTAKLAKKRKNNWAGKKGKSKFNDKKRGKKKSAK